MLDSPTELFNRYFDPDYSNYTRLTSQIATLWSDKKIENITEMEFKDRLSNMIRNDPRSIYRKQSTEGGGKNSIFFVNFMNLTITVWFDENCADVLKVVPYYEHNKEQP